MFLEVEEYIDVVVFLLRFQYHMLNLPLDTFYLPSFYMDPFFGLSWVNNQFICEAECESVICVLHMHCNLLAHYLIFGYESVIVVYIYYVVRIWLMSSMCKLLDGVSICLRHLSQ